MNNLTTSPRSAARFMGPRHLSAKRAREDDDNAPPLPSKPSCLSAESGKPGGATRVVDRDVSVGAVTPQGEAVSAGAHMSMSTRAATAAAMGSPTAAVQNATELSFAPPWEPEPLRPVLIFDWDRMRLPVKLACAPARLEDLGISVDKPQTIERTVGVSKLAARLALPIICAGADVQSESKPSPARRMRGDRAWWDAKSHGAPVKVMFAREGLPPACRESIAHILRPDHAWLLAQKSNEWLVTTVAREYGFADARLIVNEQPDDVRRLARAHMVLIPQGNQKSGNAGCRVATDFGHPALREQLVGLQWLELITGEPISHDGTYRVVLSQSKSPLLQARPSGLAFGSKRLARDAGLAGRMAMPQVIGKALRDQILSLSESDIEKDLAGLGLPKEAVDSATFNLSVVKRAVWHLPAGRVLSDEAQWCSDRTDRALGVVSIDEQLQSVQFPSWRALEDWSATRASELAACYEEALCTMRAAKRSADAQSIVARDATAQLQLEWVREHRLVVGRSDECLPIYSPATLDALIETVLRKSKRATATTRDVG